MKSSLGIQLLLLASFFAGNAQTTDEIKLQPYFGAVVVSNIDQSIQWYTGMLNLSVRNRYDSEERGFKQVNLQSPDILIELVELKSMLSKEDALKEKSKETRLMGFYKIGFVTKQFDTLHKILTEKKVTFVGSIVQDPISGKRNFLISDPDGNRLQFFEY